MSQPNVLFITSDQHRKDSMSMYGNTFCQTPHLEALAKDGTVFNRAYTPHATCTPSRASMLTGQYGSTHQGYTIGVNTPYDCVKMSDSFNEAGYQTHICGKMHLRSCCTPGEFESPPHVFNEEFFSDFKGPYFGFQHTKLFIGHTTEPHSAGMHYRVWLRENGFTDEDFKKHFHYEGDGKEPNHVMGPWEIPEHLHPSAFVSTTAKEAIDSAVADDKPFFVWASFQDPHVPFRVPEPYASMYMDADLPNFTHTPGEHDDKPEFYKSVFENKSWDQTGWNTKIQIPSAGVETLEPEVKRQREALYHGMITHMDTHIGKIIDHLKEKGLYNNTIIVFTTDHGDYLGHHGYTSKGLFAYEDVYNIPYIVYDPKNNNRGQTTQALHSHVDIAPTLLSRCGIDVPSAMQGQDQSQVYTGQTESIRDCVKIENRPVHEKIYQKQLVTQQYKLVVYMGYSWGELYDLQKDPDQMENLWDNPNFAGTRAELMHRLISYEMESEGKVPERTGFA